MIQLGECLIYLKLGVYVNGDDTLSKAGKSGVEVITPPMFGGSEESSYTIKKLYAILNEFGQVYTQRCGAHVHIGADYLTSVQAWKNLLELWCNTEEIIYTISNKEGELPRPGVLTYAKPISGKYKKAIEDGSINLNNENDINEFISQIIEVQGREKENRGYGINFQNIGNEEKNTVECRVFNEDSNVDTRMQNVNLFGGMIRVAQELSIIQAKTENQRTDKEKRMIECFEGIRDGRTTESEKLQYLIELVIKENTDIYIRRYDVNSELLKSNVEFYQTLKKYIAEGPVRFEEKQLTKEKIGSVLFIGVEKPNGVDFATINGNIESLLQKRMSNIQE